MGEDFLHFMNNLAERRIAQAQEEGAFDKLPGQGKPLQLEDDSSVAPDLRIAFKILKNAGYVPPEIADRKEIDSLLDILSHCEDEAEKLRQMQKLDVILARITTRRRRAVTLDEHDPYYEMVVRRISVLQKNVKS